MDSVSFDFDQGQIIGLLGGNGAGKTTTLSMLTGVLLPSSGQISMSIGLMLICLLLRYGASGEYFAWMIAFIILPFVAVYYPVTILPPGMQIVSWLLPPTYVFESLRQLIKGEGFNMDYFLRGLGLNICYLTAAILGFIHQLNKARHRGGLLSMSE